MIQPSQQAGRLQDAGGCAPAAKAAIDGLVDAGVLPDDGPAYVRTITYLVPLKGKPGMTVWVSGETENKE